MHFEAPAQRTRVRLQRLQCIATQGATAHSMDIDSIDNSIDNAIGRSFDRSIDNAIDHSIDFSTGSSNEIDRSWTTLC